VASSGIEILLKAAGIDPGEIRASIDQFMSSMKATADAINANQGRIETKLNTIISNQEKASQAASQATTTHVLENGRPTGVLLTDEKFPDEVLKDAGVLEGWPNGRSS
jgi:hypothetical protein